MKRLLIFHMVFFLCWSNDSYAMAGREEVTSFQARSKAIVRDVMRKLFEMSFISGRTVRDGCLQALFSFFRLPLPIQVFLFISTVEFISEAISQVDLLAIQNVIVANWEYFCEEIISLITT